MIRNIDWATIADKASGMSSTELHYAILDCFKAAKAADELERAGIAVDKTGGYYMDELSIYRKEQTDRRHNKR